VLGTPKYNIFIGSGFKYPELYKKRIPTINNVPSIKMHEIKTIARKHFLMKQTNKELSINTKITMINNNDQFYIKEYLRLSNPKKNSLLFDF